MTSTALDPELCVLQHHDDTPLGLLGGWLELRGLPHRIVRPDRGDEVPADPRGCNGLVVLGSEHSVNSAEPAWIGAELELTRRAVEQRVPVLGICFGGQMLARALGAAIEPAPGPSIGWREVTSASGDAFDPVCSKLWLHYNYETFSLPQGAELLGECAGAPAAFRAGPHLGVQFHPEATVEIVTTWARWDAERLARLGLAPDPLIVATPDRRAAARDAALALFDSWMASGGR